MGNCLIICNRVDNEDNLVTESEEDIELPSYNSTILNSCVISSFNPPKYFRI